MLDENLPTFYLKQAPDQVQHHQTYYLTYRGSDPEAAYNIKHPDPSSPGGKNCYAAALFDSYNTDILYGEVLIRPEWTQPSLSQEEIRRNGSVPPPPQPILPQEFTVQLYNPDQQVVVRQKSGGWGGAPTYNFSMPQQTFRLPSSSALDRQLSDPAADATTPQINFTWKRDGKLSKDMACYMTGKSNDVVKKKHKEPDIIVGIFQALKEVTIYESNYHRIEIEDPKGLEVVLLLTAAVLKDVYYTPLREAFNVSDGSPQTLRKHSSSLSLVTGGLQRKTSPRDQNTFLAVPEGTSSAPLSRPSTGSGLPAAMGGLYAPPPSINDDRRKSLPHLQTNSAPPHLRPPPPADPRSQWEIDAETTRLQAQADKERRSLDARRKEQEKADAAEARRLKKQMEIEDKERRRKQAEVDKETERLLKKYGNQQDLLPPLPPRQQAPASNSYQQSYPQQQQQQQWQPAPYAQPQPGPSQPLGSNGLPIRTAQQPKTLVKQKKSFWHLGGSRDMAGALPPQERTVR